MRVACFIHLALSLAGFPKRPMFGILSYSSLTNYVKLYCGLTSLCASSVSNRGEASTCLKTVDRIDVLVLGSLVSELFGYILL